MTFDSTCHSPTAVGTVGEVAREALDSGGRFLAAVIRTGDQRTSTIHTRSPEAALTAELAACRALLASG